MVSARSVQLCRLFYDTSVFCRYLSRAQLDRPSFSARAAAHDGAGHSTILEHTENFFIDSPHSTPLNFHIYVSRGRRRYSLGLEVCAHGLHLRLCFSA